ncbi:MAG: hypothetical protein R6X34_29165 [Chloroflexota bacterium]
MPTVFPALVATITVSGWWWCVVPHLIILITEPKGRETTSLFPAGDR